MSSLIADKGYDGDEFRADIVMRGAKPVIPSKSNRIALHRFDKRAYKGRNVNSTHARAGATRRGWVSD
jgi:transposase